jgi:hypothetical protein
MQYSLPPGVDARQPYMLALKPKHSTWYKTESQNARNRPRNLALNPGMPPLDCEDLAKALASFEFRELICFPFELWTIKLPRKVRFETRIRHFYRSERSRKAFVDHEIRIC